MTTSGLSRGRARAFFAARPRLVDALTVVGFLVAVLASAPLWMVPGEFWWLVLAGAIIVFFRRSAPLWVLALLLVGMCAAIVTTGLGSGFEFALGIAVYTVALRRSALTAWLATIGATAVTGAVIWFYGEHDLAYYLPSEEWDDAADLRVVYLVVVSLIMVASLALGTSMRNRREHERNLADRANQLALERDQVTQIAVAGERARIAREMHDVVAHSVQVMLALSDGARALLDKSPDRAGIALEELSATGRSTLADMRRILGILRDDSEIDFAPQPGDLDLDPLFVRFRSAGLPVQYVYAGAPLPQDSALQLSVYRIVQEALTNVLRYSPQASEIVVSLERSSTQVEITVRNNDPMGSPRTDPAHSRGRGLIGMRERASAFDGYVTAGPSQGGWRVHAILKLDSLPEQVRTAPTSSTPWLLPK